MTSKFISRLADCLRCNTPERVLLCLLPTIGKKSVRFCVLSEEQNLLSGGYYTNVLLQKFTLFLLIFNTKIK